MLGNNNTTAARANFLTVPGRSIEYTTDANGNITKEVYKTGIGESAPVLYAVNHVYDASGNIVTSFVTAN